MKRKLFLIAWAAVIQAAAQTGAGRLLPAVPLASPITNYRTALKGVFDVPGHERRVLQGTVTYDGNAIPFTFTRELDQNVRLDVGAPGSKSTLLVTSIASGPAASQTPAAARQRPAES